MFNNFSEYWWVILFWLPGLLASKQPVNTRTYKWYFLGMIAYFSAFAIWSEEKYENREVTDERNIFDAMRELGL